MTSNFCGANDTYDCKLLVDTFTKVCEQLSVPLAVEKSVGPVQKLIFLGYEVSLKVFQSLIGKLAFFGKAVRACRAFFAPILRCDS